MISKKDIKREYKEREIPSGVFQIKNTVNGKVFLGSSLNLDGVLNSQSFKLANGSHSNRELQQDWKRLGADKFVLEILEEVQEPENAGSFNLKDELTLLEMIWLEKLQPFGDNGYNTSPKIRQV